MVILEAADVGRKRKGLIDWKTDWRNVQGDFAPLDIKGVSEARKDVPSKIW